jgi:hypothetical protein
MRYAYCTLRELKHIRQNFLTSLRDSAAHRGEKTEPQNLKIVGWARCAHHLLNHRVGTKSCPPYLAVIRRNALRLLSPYALRELTLKLAATSSTNFLRTFIPLL